MAPTGSVEAVFVGQPKLIADDRGSWTSSIFRDRTSESVAISLAGLAGDKVTQPYHGGPGAAICVHLSEHYSFWNSHYEMSLKAGDVGENITLRGLAEEEIHVGDVVWLGTALVQVRGPRVPCANLARRIGRPDWVKLTIRENRTGFYTRVLEPGSVREGDAWLLERRMNDAGSIPAINRCMYIKFDPGFARGMLEMDGLDRWWKEQALEKLQRQDDHWTSQMNEG